MFPEGRRWRRKLGRDAVFDVSDRRCWNRRQARQHDAQAENHQHEAQSGDLRAHISDGDFVCQDEPQAAGRGARGPDLCVRRVMYEAVAQH
ncbi:hypothetical protein ACS49_00805 [Bacillus cereus]|nr:hypothetical protein ACS49_00805 [Bacillus cereus]